MQRLLAVLVMLASCGDSNDGAERDGEFLDAAASLGEVELTATSAASLGDGKIYANDTPPDVFVYDEDADDFVVR